MNLPPQNIEAEESVIASILIDNTIIDDIRDLLSPDDFYKTAHKIIYRSMMDLHIDNNPVDLVTVVNKLRSNNELEKVGGAIYLSRVIDTAPYAANIIHYAKMIINCCVRRRLIVVSNQIQNTAFDLSENIDDIVDSCQQQIFGVTISDVKKHNSVTDDLIEVIDELEIVWEKKILITGVPVGFAPFDRALCGLQNGDLIILAGRPSMGKTALVMQMMKNSAVEGYRPFVFSLEQPKKQLYHRLLASDSRIPTTAFRSGYWNKDDWKLIADASATLSGTNFKIDDRGGLTYKEIRKTARFAKKNYGTNWIIIDHLGLVTGAGNKNKNDEIGLYTKQFKVMAKELDMPVMVLSQLNRNADGIEPRLLHLRDSGEIEQNADVVVFINRPEMYSKAEEVKGLADLIIAKQRQGPLCRIKLVWFKETTRFELAIRDSEREHER